MNRLRAVDKPPTCAGEWLMPKMGDRDEDGRPVWDWICPLCKTEWTSSRNVHSCKGSQRITEMSQR